MAKEKRNQIIRAANKRFARHGINKTTLDEIARDLRIGKATIYHYFDSKEMLFIETLKWEADQFIESIKSIFSNSDQPKDSKLLEYISFKENTAQHSKILYEILLKVIQESALENEAIEIANFLLREEEIIEQVLKSFYKEKLVSIHKNLPNYILMLSWGMVFGNRMHKNIFPDKVKNYKDLLIQTFDIPLH